MSAIAIFRQNAPRIFTFFGYFRFLSGPKSARPIRKRGWNSSKVKQIQPRFNRQFNFQAALTLSKTRTIQEIQADSATFVSS